LANGEILQEEIPMAFNNNDRKDRVNRRRALERMIWVGSSVLWMTSGGGPKSLDQISAAKAATAMAQAKPTIPIIVKDKTSFYWRIVLAGARRAGRDLGVNVVELGADSESDINDQIDILATAAASMPAAIVIAPARFAELGRPVDNAAQKTRIICIDSDVGSTAFTSIFKD
jgi:ABC-type sugar transport system substrate-binding protein